MSKKYKQFFHGKDIPKSRTGRKPTKGEPNTNLDTYNSKTGLFRSRRKFDSKGFAYKDMDVADEHKNYDHVHDFIETHRENDRNPTKKEKREFKKAKRKRRFFDD